MGGQWAADFIGRVEHLEEDFRAILEEINRRRYVTLAAPPSYLLSLAHISVIDGLGCINEAGCVAASWAAGRPAFEFTCPLSATWFVVCRPEGAPLLNTSLPTSENSNQVDCSDEAPASVHQRRLEGEALQWGMASRHGGEGKGSDMEAGSAQVGGSAGGRRKLLYGQLPGMQWSDVNYCNKANFFLGKYNDCFRSLSQFYLNDIRRLHREMIHLIPQSDAI